MCPDVFFHYLMPDHYCKYCYEILVRVWADIVLRDALFVMLNIREL